MKPSELTPLTALYMCELIKEAGFPAGVVNTVPGLGATTGDAISRHLDIDKVAFTGSVLTGRKISAAACDSNLKKVTLELGGKSPMVVMESADVEEAANWTALGIWFNSGQDCCATSRALVHESQYEKFVAAMKTRGEACNIGQPSDEKTSFGPLISAGQRDKVLAYIQSGKEQGARVVTGGSAWAHSNGGYFVTPTVLADVKQDMKVVQEEIFGPVIVVSSFKTEEEALAMANDTTYGLAAAVFTNDARQMTRMSNALNAGTVWCNQAALLMCGVPFGGFKQSGVGRELGTYGLEGVSVIVVSCSLWIPADKTPTVPPGQGRAPEPLRGDAMASLSVGRGVVDEEMTGRPLGGEAAEGSVMAVLKRKFIIYCTCMHGEVLYEGTGA